MTLAGTRPPTVDEWEQYELHHRSRMSIKPGITGMWQAKATKLSTNNSNTLNLLNVLQNENITYSILEEMKRVTN